jgi:hypothetical protein
MGEAGQPDIIGSDDVSFEEFVAVKSQAARGRFRFLARFNGTGKPYTMTEGDPDLTVAGCPASPVGTNIPESYAPGLTMYRQGYVTDLRGCVPLQVRTPRAARPITVTVPAGRAACGS